MGKVTNPFAAIKRAGGEVENDTEEFERPEYVEPEVTDDETEEEESVPDGTAKEIMTWVGDDKERAQKALSVEEAKSGGGRRGLTRELSDKLEN